MRTAILGASGLVGRNMLDLLARQPWLAAPPLLWTSARSAGTRLLFRGQELVCQEMSTAALGDVSLALFSAGAAVSRQWAPAAVRTGIWVVDNSSAWRDEKDVPLVVPEINGYLVPPLARVAVPGAPSNRQADRQSDMPCGHETDHRPGGIIANPNCSTIQIALPCAALDKAAGLREIHVTTLQAVSGAGQQGIAELAAQTAAVAGGPASGAERPAKVFARRIAANAIPEIGTLGDDGFFAEERKIHRELRKILDRADLAVTCTAVRVPVWNGHAAAVRVVLARPLDHEQAVAALDGYPGLVCHASAGGYRTPAEVSGEKLVHVGRLRHEPGRREVLLFWVVADNLLKGAAWNAVQIAAMLCGAAAR